MFTKLETSQILLLCTENMSQHKLALYVHTDVCIFCWHEWKILNVSNLVTLVNITDLVTFTSTSERNLMRHQLERANKNRQKG